MSADTDRDICGRCQRHIYWFGEEPPGDCDYLSCRFNPAVTAPASPSGPVTTPCPVEPDPRQSGSGAGDLRCRNLLAHLDDNLAVWLQVWDAYLDAEGEHELGMAS